MHHIIGSVLRALLGGTAVLAAYSAYKILHLLYQRWTDPLRAFPGPPNPSFLWGHMKELYETETPLLHERWTAEYGTTWIYNAFLGTRRLFTADIKAINHILINNYIYQKPLFFRYHLSSLVGNNGLLTVEEDRHRQQRRIMNPAFGPAQIRELTGIFLEQSAKLRDVWLSEGAKEPGGKAQIDALAWLSRMTLDTIGLAGFNYDFDALSDNPEKNELNKAFSTVFKTGSGGTYYIRILRGLFPSLRWLPAMGFDSPLSMSRLKALLFTLIRAFEFELAVPVSEIGSRTLLVRRPVLLSQPEKENQMPLFVKPYVPGSNA
ncbi:hypothetical protein CVT24_012799 [Panaeolus cyanescens]|uniref:Cytochrome P450 n=1 Tax=Panaeolus cyanescens TaxID=181874 RepID=A0A409W2L3_9AGAR|nr:hypothetical protein CVT24_012799 [Panaeolus cyanescens]